MINQISIEIASSKPLPPDISLQPKVTPWSLAEPGFVMPIIVQTPSLLCSPPFSNPLRTVLVMALLDTGATRTCISDVIAQMLELKVTGYSPIQTAGGTKNFPDYMVDVLFPNHSLKGFEDWMVGSCNLPYTENPSSGHVMAKTNFGVLIGRDMMRQWNIVWNGPTSSVFISD
jgi:hypothetical protein